MIVSSWSSDWRATRSHLGPQLMIPSRSREFYPTNPRATPILSRWMGQRRCDLRVTKIPVLPPFLTFHDSWKILLVLPSQLQIQFTFMSLVDLICESYLYGRSLALFGKLTADTRIRNLSWKFSHPIVAQFIHSSASICLRDHPLLAFRYPFLYEYQDAISPPQSRWRAPARTRLTGGRIPR